MVVPSSAFACRPGPRQQRRVDAAPAAPLRGAATGGSDNLLHGTGLVSVVALPKGQRLVPAPTENTVVATPDLAFEVTVQDTGDAQEVQIRWSCASSRARSRS